MNFLNRITTLITKNLNVHSSYNSKTTSALKEVFDKYSYYGEEKHIFNNNIIQKYKDSDDSNDNLAVAISYLGEGAKYRKNAIQYFEKYLNNPSKQTYFSTWHIYSDLAELYEKEYQFDKAINCLKKAITINKGSNSADFIRIGNILLKEDVKLAISYYEDLKKNPIYKKHKYSFDIAYNETLQKQNRGYVYKPRKKIN